MYMILKSQKVFEANSSLVMKMVMKTDITFARSAVNNVAIELYEEANSDL